MKIHRIPLFLTAGVVLLGMSAVMSTASANERAIVPPWVSMEQAFERDYWMRRGFHRDFYRGYDQRLAPAFVPFRSGGRTLNRPTPPPVRLIAPQPPSGNPNFAGPRPPGLTPEPIRPIPKWVPPFTPPPVS